MRKVRVKNLGISPHEAHLWIAFAETLFSDSETLLKQGILSNQERAQAEKIPFEKARRAYIATRTLCRKVLSKYAPIDPPDWQFRKNPFGRPEIANTGLNSNLSFSLSHTDGLIACLVTSRQEAGVDVEAIHPLGNADRIAKRLFTYGELSYLRKAKNHPQKLKRFYKIWTLKEAYAKARGLGFYLPFTDFSFNFGPPEDTNISISFENHIEETSKRWQFSLFQPTAQHQLALAIQKNFHLPIQITQKITESDWI